MIGPLLASWLFECRTVFNLFVAKYLTNTAKRLRFWLVIPAMLVLIGAGCATDRKVTENQELQYEDCLINAKLSTGTLPGGVFENDLEHIKLKESKEHDCELMYK